MISTFFAQFRHQYANGGLSTELLMTHAEQYLVKATVTIDGQVVATALAADPHLTAADDQAKSRALAMLGFGPQTVQASPNGVSQAAAKTTVAASTAVATSATVSDPEATPEKTPPAAPVIPASAPEDSEDSEDIGRPLDSITPDEAPAPSDVPASSLAAVAIENFDDTNPVDLSDVIAQTDVEMARLGWSSLQGRTYLEQTFSKRSRQQLTDEELLTFLLYLESQATPDMG
ncbi:MAG: hypothetical protein AAF243_12590 [Cyanobacteria bacterium P01_A01_bin.137]